MPAYKNENVKGPKKWYCKFNYKDWQGEIKTKVKRGFEFKRDADKWERDFLEHNANTPNTLFKDLIKSFGEDMDNRVSAGHIKKYSRKIYEYRIKRILPAFGDMPINTITPNHVRKWQIKELSDLKPKTQLGYCITLKRIFEFACQYFSLPQNPCKIAGNIGSIKSRKYDMQIWTLDQFEAFIKALENRPSKKGQRHRPAYYIAFFTLLFFSGCRIGEALALNVGDFVSGCIYINKNKNPYNEILTPKTEKANRAISLPQTVCSMLAKHIECLQDNEPTAPLFPKLSRSTVSKVLKQTAQLANVPVIRVHDIRHSHASMLINVNVQPLVLSERLGHENIQTTLNIYSHLYKTTADSIADVLEAMLA